ncbi:conserved hypothetical protein [delta proteobacterium NaphS2]|nr:conserved hypothetical protein [delta proteobacterium NaphS2]
MESGTLRNWRNRGAIWKIGGGSRELMVELTDKSVAGALSKALREAFEDQVFLSP